MWGTILSTILKNLRTLENERRNLLNQGLQQIKTIPKFSVNVYIQAQSLYTGSYLVKMFSKDNGIIHNQWQQVLQHLHTFSKIQTFQEK